MEYSEKNQIFILEKGRRQQSEIPRGAMLLRVLAAEEATVPLVDDGSQGVELRVTIANEAALCCQRLGPAGRVCECAIQRRERDGVSIVLPQDDLELFVSLLPWHAAGDPRQCRTTSMRHFVYLPFCGWLNNVWHDGVLYHVSSQHQGSATVCGEGGAVRLSVSAEDLSVEGGNEAGLSLATLNFRSSLVAAFHSVFGSHKHESMALRFDDPDLGDALAAVLLRMSQPEMALYLVDPPTHLPTWRYWRRFCQNLGIDFGLAHRKLVPVQTFDLRWFREQIPKSQWHRMVQSFNNVTAVIPLEIIE